MARALQEKGVEQVFTLSGGFCNPALEGFMECGISVINAPSEQVAGHLADAHTRITRKPAVCLVGPEGFAAAVSAMMEAWGERSPVIFVTGSSTLKRQGSGGFKEIDDVAIAAPLTKYSVSITDGERISEFVDRAWKIALSGYPGAVHLSLPVDIMFSSFDEERDARRATFRSQRWRRGAGLALSRGSRTGARQDSFGEQANYHWRAWGLVVRRGGGTRAMCPAPEYPGVQRALPSEAVVRGLRCLHGAGRRAPVPPVEAGDRGIRCGHHGRRAPRQPDEFRQPAVVSGIHPFALRERFAEEIEMNRAADQALLSDPGAFFAALGDIDPLADDWLAINRARRADWVERMVDDIPQLADGRIHPLQLALDVQGAMNDGDWLVIDGGNTHFWSEISVNIAGWRGLELGNILHPGTFSMLGVGVPFASVAKLNHPDKNVVVISGDGAFLSGGSSIEAAFQEKLPIVVVIDNNGGLDCISQQQERLFANQQHFATDFRDIPFHSMFEGLGGHGELVVQRDDIIPAVKRAIASGKTACVNVKTVGHISPIVLATTSKRDKASIE